MSKKFASIVLEVAIAKALDYSIPEHLVEHIHRGSYVEVPLRGNMKRGFVVAIKESASVAKTMPISRVLSENPLLDDELFDIALFMAQYYATALGKVIKTMLPSGVRKNTQTKEQFFVTREATKEDIRLQIPILLHKAESQARLLEELLLVRKGMLLTKLLEKTKATISSVKALEQKGFVSLKKVDPDADILENEEYLRTKAKKLHPDQQEALGKIITSLSQGHFQTHLLFGITGSGKTEVYLQAIQEARKQNKGVIMLVPEIALTQQTIQRFKSRFDEKIAVLHHRISDGKRKEAWDDIMTGKAPIVIGARSAIFCPMPNLGLIIVDEEHESSYKQSDDSPCYSARDIAVVRGKKRNATVILGSATPSLESYFNAMQGKYLLTKLKSRHASSLPSVQIVDMKHEYEKAKGMTLFSDVLLKEIIQCQKNGEQAILFLNRRGYHTNLKCLSCGESVSCPHCSTALTFHKKDRFLACHLCGYMTAPPQKCPQCKKEAMLKFSGVGTEKVEAALKAILPDIRVVRIDRDATKHKGSLEILLNQFRTGKADVLIGTQMIAKGLHFPEVTLVGVLNCDTQLHLPDFRAQETIFQLITQVAGRAGRGEIPGKVILQTQLPEHETILLAKNHDFEGFYKEEIELRKNFFFPPYSKIVKIAFSASSEEAAKAMAEKYHDAVQRLLPEEVILHPVVPSGHPKIKDHYRFHILVRGKSTAQLVSLLEQAEASLKTPIKRLIDVDPTSVFF